MDRSHDRSFGVRLVLSALLAVVAVACDGSGSRREVVRGQPVLRVAAVHPADGATGVPFSTGVAVTFSHPVAAGTVIHWDGAGWAVHASGTTAALHDV